MGTHKPRFGKEVGGFVTKIYSNLVSKSQKRAGIRTIGSVEKAAGGKRSVVGVGAGAIGTSERRRFDSAGGARGTVWMLLFADAEDVAAAEAADAGTGTGTGTGGEVDVAEWPGIPAAAGEMPAPKATDGDVLRVGT